MKKSKNRSLSDFFPLTEAEEKLMHACAQGSDILFSENLPETGTLENIIRAEFFRFLALGGDEKTPIHEMGVQVQGAWIKGILNFDHCRVCRIWLGFCYFESTLQMRNSDFSGSIHLNGSSLPDVRADGLICRGSLFFKKGIVRGGKFSMCSSEIDGDLEFAGANFQSGPNISISLDRSKISGSIFLRDEFICQGGISLSGISVSNGLEISRAEIASKISEDHWLLDLNGAVIERHFLFRDMLQPIRSVNLEGLRVRYLIDEDKSWGADINFGSCHFEYFSGIALLVPAKKRIEWLKKQTSSPGDYSNNFSEQSWASVVSTLERSGLLEHAKIVGMTAESIKVPRPKINYAGNLFFSELIKVPLWVVGVLSELLIGYGYRPWRLLGWFLAVWVLGGTLYWYAALNGFVAPSSPLVYLNKELSARCVENWVFCTLPESHSAFTPFAYSLDVMLPVVDLDQEKNWTFKTPGIMAGIWNEIFSNWTIGHLFRLVYWFQIVFGWGSSLIFIALITGFMKKKEK